MCECGSRYLFFGYGTKMFIPKYIYETCFPIMPLFVGGCGSVEVYLVYGPISVYNTWV